MSKAAWKMTQAPFVTNEKRYFVYKSEETYSVVQLAADLAAAGAEVSYIKYETDPTYEDSFFGGRLSLEGFASRYDSIRTKVPADMNYELTCSYKDVDFKAAMSDDKEGNSYNKIAFTEAEGDELDINGLLDAMGVQTV